MLQVILDNLRSVYNVGSIFRSSDTLGVDKIYLAGITPTPLHPKIHKTALGSCLSVPWEHHCDTHQLLNYLNIQIPLIAFETSPQAQSIFDFIFPPDACLIFGNEVSGINQKILNLCQSVVCIPQAGVKESLNVASAAAIGLFAYRQAHPNI